MSAPDDGLGWMGEGDDDTPAPKQNVEPEKEAPSAEESKRKEIAPEEQPYGGNDTPPVPLPDTPLDDGLANLVDDALAEKEAKSDSDTGPIDAGNGESVPAEEEPARFSFEARSEGDPDAIADFKAAKGVMDGVEDAGQAEETAGNAQESDSDISDVVSATGSPGTSGSKGSGTASLPKELIFNQGEEIAEKYEIIDHLGTGASGVVYRVKKVGLDRDAALKIFRHAINDASTDKDQVVLFKDEAQRVAKLDHKNVAKVYDIGEFSRATEGGQKRYAFHELPLLEGIGLDKQIQRWRKESASEQGEFYARYANYPMALDDVVRFAKDIASGLAHAHTRGLVHRDLKPENIMYDKDNNPVVVDFGLSRLVKVTSKKDTLRLARQTRQEEHQGFRGSFAYAPHEQLLGLHDKVDERADIYALGAILYELLTGHRPFEVVENNKYRPKARGQKEQGKPYRILGRIRGRDEIKVVTEMDRRHTEERLPSPRDLRGEIDPGLDAIVMKMLKKDQGDRQASMDVVLAQLHALEQGELIQGAHYSRLTRWKKKSSKFIRDHKRKMVAGAAVVVLSGYAAGARISRYAYERETRPRIEAAISAFESSKSRSISQEQSFALEAETGQALRSAEVWVNQFGTLESEQYRTRLERQQRDIRALRYANQIDALVSSAGTIAAIDTTDIDVRLRSIDASYETFRLALTQASGTAKQWVDDLKTADASERRSLLERQLAEAERTRDARIADVYTSIVREAQRQYDGLPQTANEAVLRAEKQVTDAALVRAREWAQRQQSSIAAKDAQSVMERQQSLLQNRIDTFEYQQVISRAVAVEQEYRNLGSRPSLNEIAGVASDAKVALEQMTPLVERLQTQDALAQRVAIERLIGTLDVLKAKTERRESAERYLAHYRTARDAPQRDSARAYEALQLAHRFNWEVVAEEAVVQNIEGDNEQARASAFVKAVELEMHNQIRARDRYCRDQVEWYRSEVYKFADQLVRGRILDEQEFRQHSDALVPELERRLDNPTQDIAAVRMDAAQRSDYLTEARQRANEAKAQAELQRSLPGFVEAANQTRRTEIARRYVERLDTLYRSAPQENNCTPQYNAAWRRMYRAIDDASINDVDLRTRLESDVSGFERVIRPTEPVPQAPKRRRVS